MKTSENQPNLKPEPESLAALEKAALESQRIAEQTVMVYGPPNMMQQNPPFIGMSMLEQMMKARQAEQTAAPKPLSNPVKWKCSGCGTENQSRFCMECGQPAPETWRCTCGRENNGRFCTDCGNPKPVEPSVTVRAYTETDLPEMIAVWNAVIDAGNAFPQEEPLDAESGAAFFAQQTYTGVAEKDGGICGLYILHPNNVGRCGHICNASYAVSETCRGQHIGEQLVLDCLSQAKVHGFRVLQFNAVVEGNTHARHLYERLGFTQLGTIKGGFRMPDGSYANICPYYREV